MRKILILISLFALNAFAGVNLKNGNFYISYIDIVVPGAGEDLEIHRTYNSKATEVGWFGFGWGSDLETRLVVNVDSSVTIHESGQGSMTRFTPKTPVDGKMAAARIVEEMRKKGRVNESTAKKLIEKLANDVELRGIYSKRYGITQELADGTVLFSNNRGIQKLVKKKGEFIRTYSNGNKNYFNSDGKLIKVVFKNKYAIDLNYDKFKRLKKVKDSHGKQLHFDWYADGKVKSVWSAGDKKVKYKYEGANLVEAINVHGEKYNYEYDKNHNMTNVAYGDGTSIKMTYEPKTFFISSFTNREKQTIRYEYKNNPKNPNYHYWTLVKRDLPNGKERVDRYEYEIKSKIDGELYTYRILTIINNLKTESFFTECCNLPQKITRGNHTTNFEYNKKGLLTKKYSTTGEYIELEYDKKFNKISMVRKKNSWTKYKYNKIGNLEFAQDSGGQKVKLIYDFQGRIKTMVDFDPKKKKNRILSFTYNNLGKPITINMKGVGKINVKYNNYGEITKVDSKSGTKMAIQVTQAFQSLLSIVKPAGVNLSL